MARADKLNLLLKSLANDSPDIEGCALVSEDSLVIASVLPEDLDELRVAGICATVLSLGVRAASVLDRGTPQQVLIRGDRGYIVLMTAARNTMLVALTTNRAKLGLVFLDMSLTIEGLNKALMGK